MNSNYWKNKILSRAYNVSLNSFWLGLSSSQPTVAGGNVSEPNLGGYQRVRITAFTNPANGVISNASSITFPKSTEAWFTNSNKASYWVLFDGESAGAHVLCWGQIENPLAILRYSTITMPAGAIQISCENGLL